MKNIKKGKFIVIEGVDGSGKSVQFSHLIQRFKKETKGKILIADFPRYYDSVWGKLIGELLSAKYGDFIGFDPHISVLPYMLDEYTWSREIGKQWVEKGKWIFSNRFFTSNVHQVAKYKGSSQKKFREWMWSTGYDKLGILKPDLVIFLDVSPEISSKLNLQKNKRGYLKNKKQDLAEKNLEHQISAYKEYNYMVKNNKYWQKVNCVTNGKMDSPEVIHEKVWKLVEKVI